MLWNRKKAASVFDPAPIKQKMRREGSRLGQGRDTIAMISEGVPRAREIMLAISRAGWASPLRKSRLGWDYIDILDQFGVYGERLVKLHDQTCAGDIVQTAAVLDAADFNMLNIQEVARAIDRPEESSVVPSSFVEKFDKMYPLYSRHIRASQR